MGIESSIYRRLTKDQLRVVEGGELVGAGFTSQHPEGCQTKYGEVRDVTSSNRTDTTATGQLNKCDSTRTLTSE